MIRQKGSSTKGSLRNLPATRGEHVRWSGEIEDYEKTSVLSLDILTALRRLPPEHQVLLVLCDIYGFAAMELELRRIIGVERVTGERVWQLYKQAKELLELFYQEGSSEETDE